MTIARIEDVRAGFQAVGADINVIDGRAISAKRAAGSTPYEFAAAGNGIANDRLAFIAALASPDKITANGTFLVSGLPTPAEELTGRATLLRSATGNLMSGAATGRIIDGLTFDMNRTVLGNAPGHGMSLQGDDISIRDVTVKGFGSDGIGGGSGVLIYGPDETTKAQRPRLDGAKFFADPTAAGSFGWIWANVDYGIASRLYAQDVRNPGGAASYAHELKNNARYNSLSQLIAKNSQAALAYGQDTAGVDGSDYNVATNLIGDGCDVGILVGEGFGNVFSASVQNAEGAAGAQKYAVHLVGGAAQNLVTGLSTAGPFTAGARLEGPRNVVQIAAHDTAANIVEFRAGSERNLVEVVHPGTRLTIEGAYLDVVGNGLKGNTANVIHSPVTGEWFGSISGSFKWKLGDSGATWLTTQRFRFEDDATVMMTGATPTGQSFGFQHNTPARTSTGGLTHTSNATAASEYWEMRTGGANIVRWYASVMRAIADAAYDLGAATFRFRDTFSQRFRPGAGAVIWTSGAGTPEGVMTAPVGSFYTRTDGAAGTTLYVKETGTGSTGWVAK